MYDSHIHSFFSGDSESDAYEICKAALDKNLKGIAFTDHLDIDYPNYDEIFLINFDKYHDYIKNLKYQQRNNIDVLYGIEVGIQPHVLEESLKIVKKYDFDFVIMSTHIVSYTDLHNGDFTKNKNKFDAYMQYFKEFDSLIDLFTEFDVLGHLDMIRRYGDYVDKNIDIEQFKDVIDNILRKVINLGKGIELNSSGYRYGLNSPMPSFEIIKRYKELGGEILTFGSDAHFPEHIAYNFNMVEEIAKSAGFKYVCHFEARKPVFDKI
jgi:histidinol-phosphatase (PHP family)